MSAVKLESSPETDSWAKPYWAVTNKVDAIAAWSTADLNHTMFYYTKCFCETFFMELALDFTTKLI